MTKKQAIKEQEQYRRIRVRLQTLASQMELLETLDQCQFSGLMDVPNYEVIRINLQNLSRDFNSLTTGRP